MVVRNSMTMADGTSKPTPAFSVIITTYNRGAMLERAIRSVLAQTFQAYELIVVDDASKDEMAHVVSGFGDERIIYVRHDKNRGPAAARNTGIRLAKAPLITILDDDDEFLPPLLERMDEIFSTADAKVGFAWCGVSMVRDAQGKETVVGERKWRADTNDPQQAVGIGGGYGVMIRRTCFDQVGLFNENFWVHYDMDMLFKLVQTGSFVVLPQVLVKIHEHTTPRVTSMFPKRIQELEEIMRRNQALLSRYPELEIYFPRKIASLHYRLGNRSNARRFLLDALQKQPGNLKTWKHLLRFEVLRRDLSWFRRFAESPKPRGSTPE